jgi:DnaJ-class molecular chaperone
MDMQKIKCKCCNGSGTQTRNDGIKILCPCCVGTGDSKFPRVTWEYKEESPEKWVE